MAIDFTVIFYYILGLLILGSLAAAFVAYLVFILSRHVVSSLTSRPHRPQETTQDLKPGTRSSPDQIDEEQSELFPVEPEIPSYMNDKYPTFNQPEERH